MKGCLGEHGCGATGFIFGGAKPMRWALCIACKGTGFVEGAPIGVAEIAIHNLGTMSAPTHTFCLKDFADAKKPLLAHVMHKAGIFPSVGQARKNGWNKPLAVGEWTVTKKKIRIVVKA